MKIERVVNELNMTKKRIIEALNYIQAQIKSGYIDLGLYDVAEVEIIEQALKEFKINHELDNN